MTRRKQIRYDPANDLYKVLGVPPSASIAEINRVYRQRAKEVHPDLNRDRADWAHAQFQRINEAHDILGDTDLRAEYDFKRGTHDVRRAEQTHRATTSYTQASRAAWAKKHRRQPAYVFLIPAFLTAISCWMLQFSHDSGLANAPTDAPVVVAVPISDNDNSVQQVDPCGGPDVTITTPTAGDSLTLPFVVKGSATGSNFDSYTVQLVTQARDSTIQWITLVKDETRRVENATLVSMDTTRYLRVIGLHGDLKLRLTVHLTDGTSLPTCEVPFHLDAQSF